MGAGDEGSHVTQRRHARFSGELKPDLSHWPSGLWTLEHGRAAPRDARAV